MDQASNRSGVGSDDIIDEITSLAEGRWSSAVEDDNDDDDESSDPQGLCLAAPQPAGTTYKQKCEEFKKLFKELPESERLILDYPCALQRDILLQGRLYLSENWLCFYSYVFRGTKFFFTSFSAREKSYQGVFRMWQNTLLDKPLTSLELWQMVKQHYGNELGLSHEEMESLQVATESSTQTSLTMRPGGDDGLGRLERPPSLRLPSMEQGTLEASTPQREDLPSPMGSQNSPNVDDSRNTLSQRRSPAPSLDRLALDRVSKRSSLSLDLNANENGVSEQSGSESNEDVEERVGLPQVQGRLYLNRVFNFSANKMFDLLFTDSSFVRRFQSIRKMTNASSTAWQKDDSGNMKRSLNYTVTISNPLIGKFSTATEYQTLYKESKDGQYYLLDAEVYTHDVPYHDYFYIHNRYYIISTSKRKCRLRVYTDVKYKKQPWGLVKSFITKNSWSGIEDNFRHLEAELLEEEAEMNQGGGDSVKISGLRRRRRAYSRTLSEHMKPNKQYGQDPEQHRDSNIGPTEMNGPYKWNITTIVAGMSLILLILTLMNLGLFFKLWAMEDIAHRMYLSTKHRLRERSEASVMPEYGPRQGPGYRTREEMHLLKTVLQDSISLLEQLRSSLMVLQQNFAMANRTAAPQ
ncbi:protein Aster-C [Scomber scombrus]|uniref:protein Aster-C n=1 Tax=Scomber scombrus TaxID=13677 RepID=UPI002DDB1468|nr:protein Aster-C [Scomber scombrus]